MKISLWGLSQYLKSNNIEFLEPDGSIKPHWLCKTKNFRKRGEIVKKIFYYLGHEVQELGYYSIRKKKCCKYPTCVCPDCYTIIKKANLRKTPACKLAGQDLEELCEELNVDRCNEIGLDMYLQEFNETQPEFLRIGLDELKAGLFYLQKMKG
jgi:hypothetical protein